MLQPGGKLVAAGYALYSSAVMLVLSWGAAVHGFTLDSSLGEFVLTHPNIRVPDRGDLILGADGNPYPHMVLETNDIHWQKLTLNVLFKVAPAARRS